MRIGLRCVELAFRLTKSTIEFWYWTRRPCFDLGSPSKVIVAALSGCTPWASHNLPTVGNPRLKIRIFFTFFTFFAFFVCFEMKMATRQSRQEKLEAKHGFSGFTLEL